MAFNLKNKKAQLQDWDVNNIRHMIMQNIQTIQGLTGDAAMDAIGNFNTQLTNLGLTYQTAKEIVPQLEEMMEQQQAANNMIPTPAVPTNQPVTINPMAPQANSHVFNLKKQAQGVGGGMGGLTSAPADDMGLNDAPEMVGDQMEEQQGINTIPQPPFARIDDFRAWMDKTDPSNVLQQVSGQNADHLKEAVEQYFASEDEGDKGRIAAEIFSDPSFPLRETGGVMAQPKHFGEIQDILKKIASKVVEKQSSASFNLKKQAQHKALDNVIMWGPTPTPRVDPFLRQPVSDWHIMERNKGFGLVVDDIWNIDYETIWRQNIMDKYSRPYRDKDGNWVGGYIQKRFEVDKNIPVTNNLQLKPGQRRKPVLPEYGLTEGRLQLARANKDQPEEGWDTSKPFNWKEAQAKKKS
jgi:hypothetical protein